MVSPPFQVGDRIKYWAGLAIVTETVTEVFYMTGVVGGDGWYVKHGGNYVNHVRRADSVSLASEFMKPVESA